MYKAWANASSLFFGEGAVNVRISTYTMGKPSFSERDNFAKILINGWLNNQI